MLRDNWWWPQASADHLGVTVDKWVTEFGFGEVHFYQQTYRLEPVINPFHQSTKINRHDKKRVKRQKIKKTIWHWNPLAKLNNDIPSKKGNSLVVVVLGFATLIPASFVQHQTTLRCLSWYHVCMLELENFHVWLSTISVRSQCVRPINLELQFQILGRYFSILYSSITTVSSKS